MKEIFTKSVGAAVVATSLFGFVNVALAEDVGVGASVEVNGAMQAMPSKPGIGGKLQQMRQEFKGERQEFREGVKEDRMEMNADIKAKLDAATSTDAKKAIMMEAREERKDFRASTTEERKGMMQGEKEKRGEMRAEAKTQAGMRLGVSVERLQNAVTRFGQIIGRIDSRIAKVTQAGGNTAAAMTAEASAKAAVDAAGVKVQAAADAVAMLKTSADPKAEMDSVKASVKVAAESLKTAQESIKATLAAIMQASVEVKADASASTSVKK